MKAQEGKIENIGNKDSAQESKKKDIKSIEDLQSGKEHARNGYGDRETKNKL